jgi:hypothetical protein
MVPLRLVQRIPFWFEEHTVGSFYVNFAVRGRTQAEVADSLRAAGREALVSPSIDEITFFFDRATERRSEKEIVRVGETVSRDLRSHVLAVSNQDDDVLAYWLFTSGELVDEYNSCPGDFTNSPTGGNSVVLCSAFEVPKRIGEVEKTLHHTNYSIASARHAALAKAIGLPWKYAERGYTRVLVSMNDKRMAKIEGIDPRQIVRIDQNGQLPSEEGSDDEQVTLRELERETEHLPYVTWVGSDKRFHYFETREEKRYKVARGEWDTPSFFSSLLPRPDDGIGLFVTIKDGKITMPDPSKMMDLFDGDSLMPPDF